MFAVGPAVRTTHGRTVIGMTCVFSGLIKISFKFSFELGMSIHDSFIPMMS